MRLSNAQLFSIRNQVEKLYGEILIDIFLYGSRTRDDLKGGDIDLLIVVKEESYEKAQSKVYKLLNEIKKSPSIGDRKIDLKVCFPKMLRDDPFLQSLESELVKI